MAKGVHEKKNKKEEVAIHFDVGGALAQVDAVEARVDEELRGGRDEEVGQQAGHHRHRHAHVDRRHVIVVGSASPCQEGHTQQLAAPHLCGR